MFVYKKHTSSHDFPYGNLLHGCIVHIPSMCLRIGLLLITLVLIPILLGIGAFLELVTRLIAIEARLITSWPCWASLAYVTLGQGNGECLAKYLLRSARLGVLLGRPKLRCWGTKLWPSCHWSPRMRGTWGTRLNCLLVTFCCRMQVVLVLLN